MSDKPRYNTLEDCVKVMAEEYGDEVAADAKAELAALCEKAASVEAAVLAEREACAAIVEDGDTPEDLQGTAAVRFIRKLAAAIRARGDA